MQDGEPRPGEGGSGTGRRRGGREILTGLLLAGLCLSCPGRPAQSLGPPDAARVARSGVRVPLPEGWAASVAADGSFRAGPRGRSVLRIDAMPALGRQIPDAQALEAAVRASAEARILERVEGEERALIRYALGGDGGFGPMAMVGAKRAGEDFFLCASLPGASPDEVEKAARACLELSAP